MSLDYIAGFFDGEGNTNLWGRQYNIIFNNTNLETLKEIQQFLKVGKIYNHGDTGKSSPRWGIKSRKPCYILKIGRRDDAKRVATLLLPRVIIKKEALEKLLRKLEEHPPVRSPWTSERIKKLLQLYIMRKSRKEMSKILNCSEMSIKGALTRYVKDLTKRRRNEMDREKIVT